MITEDYVSFETAKLLKEKGFDEHTVMVYNQNGSFMPNGAIEDTYQSFYFAPTLQMAMKWLRETHNIDISVVPHPNKEDKAFDYEFVYWNGGEIMPYDEKHPTYHELFEKTWEKYEESCEAAIKYCLENLI